MTHWIIGDIHGCALELAQLVQQINLGPEDQLLSVGDLFHRGPDPMGVIEVLAKNNARFILGNHEAKVLERFDLAPAKSDGSDRVELREDFGPLLPEDLAGDGRRALLVEPEDCPAVLRFLQQHDGYYLEQGQLPGAKPTPDGRSWCLVHAGLTPGVHPADSSPKELHSIRRLEGRGQPWWYEVYQGPNLVIFGHTPSKVPRRRMVDGLLMALGIDTACVYGGSLSAYAPELDEWQHVPCQKSGGYAQQ